MHTKIPTHTHLGEGACLDMGVAAFQGRGEEACQEACTQKQAGMCHTVIWDIQYVIYALNTEYAYNTIVF